MFTFLARPVLTQLSHNSHIAFCAYLMTRPIRTRQFMQWVVSATNPRTDKSAFSNDSASIWIVSAKNFDEFCWVRVNTLARNLKVEKSEKFASRSFVTSIQAPNLRILTSFRNNHIFSVDCWRGISVLYRHFIRCQHAAYSNIGEHSKCME